MVKNEPYRHWNDPNTNEKSGKVRVNNRLIDLETGEVLESYVEDC
jgi:hypothetical protein